MAALKPYEPTRRRLKKARDDGDVAKSRDLSAAVVTLGAVAYLAAFGLNEQKMRAFSDQIVQISADLASANMLGLSAEALRVFSLLTLPVLSAAFISALFVEVYQVGLHFRFNLLAPRFSRISCSKGIARIFGVSPETGGGAAKWCVEVVKTALRLAAAAAVSALVSVLVCRELLPSGVSEPELLLRFGRWAFLAAGGTVAMLLLAVGLCDYLVQVRRRRQRLRMDANELRQELRESEGDAQQRGMRRQLHLELIAQNIIQRVRSSRVVLLGRSGAGHRQ